MTQIKSRRMRWARHVARMGEEIKVYKVFMGKPERKRPLGRPRRRWEDGKRMDLGETGWEDMERIQLAQDRDRSDSFKCGDVPSGSGASKLSETDTSYNQKSLLCSSLQHMPFTASEPASRGVVTRMRQAVCSVCPLRALLHLSVEARFTVTWTQFVVCLVEGSTSL
jgi:hypothetical protein